MSVRFGVVGCGAIAPTHAKAILGLSNAELVGFADVVPERAVGLAEKFGSMWFAGLEELCTGCDVICVCVPSGLHAEVGVRAAELGCHVLVEKPIEVSLEAATRLVQRCKELGRFLGVISQHRFAPEIVRLRDAVACGELGKLLQGDAYIKWFRTQSYYDSGDWRGTWELDGGGCLINQGVHYVDMIQWVMGGVHAVRALTRSCAHEIEVEDVAAALVEYRSGAIGVIQGSTSFFPGFAERLEVHGRHGSVIIEADQATVWEVDESGANDGSPYGRGVTMQPTPNVRSGGQAPVEAVPAAERWVLQHRLQIQDFADAVQNGREPALTGEMALEPLKVILAIYESARLEGACVEVR